MRVQGEKSYFQCKPMRLILCRSSSCPRCTDFCWVFYVYTHRQLDFFCIFIFEWEVPQEAVLGMTHAPVLLIPILIASARFFADSCVSASFLCDLIQPARVHVMLVVAGNRIRSKQDRKSKAAWTTRSLSTPPILFTLHDSMTHNAQIKKSKKRNRFYAVQTLITF